jgi:hypothetical protein
MLNSTTKRFILPFLEQKNSAVEIEAAAVFAVAEFERSKGGGLIVRQPEERIVALSKIGYPLWLFPKNASAFVFDGFGDSSYSVPYYEMPSAKAFLESLEANLRPQEKYQAFLTDHSNFFKKNVKEKQFRLRGLIADLDFMNEFNVYRKEATEAADETNAGLFEPDLQEFTISSMLTEFDKLKMILKEEADKLPECIRHVNEATSQYLTELDFEAGAVKEEADAKIRAQEELVNPKIDKLTKDYKTKIKQLTKSFDEEIERQQKQKMKTQKLMENNWGKIRLYQREAEGQAEKKLNVYEKRWKEKIKQTEKEQNALKKELKNIENNMKKLSKQKACEIASLNFSLDAEIKFARQPIVELELARDSKMANFKVENEKLLKQEKPVIEDLNKNIKLIESINVNLELLGMQGQGLKNPCLFFVPFYVVCFEIGLTRRYLVIPPSTVAPFNFSAKLKSIVSRSKINALLTPRFKAVTILIGKIEELTKQNIVFESQLNGLAQKNNLLDNKLFMENALKGLTTLKHEGWLSDREHLVLRNQLSP